MAADRPGFFCAGIIVTGVVGGLLLAYLFTVAPVISCGVMLVIFFYVYRAAIDINTSVLSQMYDRD